MISFCTRLKSLSVTTKPLLKSETVSFLFCNAVQRSLCGNNYLFSNHIQGNRLNSDRRYYHSRNNPKNIGKIIEIEDVTNFGKKFGGRKSKQMFDEEEEIIEEEDGIENDGKEGRTLNDSRSYKAMEKNKALLGSIMVKLRSRKLKERNKEIVLEGKRLIHEAIVAGVMPKKIFFSRASDLDLLNLPQGTATYRIPYKTCKLWGDLTAPQGIIGIFQMPDEETLKSKVGSLPLTIICDNIRDPGNLGSIVRLVAGVGCEKLILTSGCTGVWEPKVVRAGAGAHFHFPIVKNCVWTNIEEMIDVNCAVFLADGNADCESADEERETSFRNKYNISDEMELTPYFSVAFQNRKTVIILGGETHGLSVDAYKFAKRRNGTRIFIPMDNKIESLNNSVALGILAFEFKRQMWLLNQHQHSEEKGTDSGNDISK